MALQSTPQIADDQAIKKGPHFILGRTTNNDIKVEDMEAECSKPVFQMGIAGPSQCIGESQWQASNLVDQLVEVGLGMDVGYPLQSAQLFNNQLASPKDLAGRKIQDRRG